MATVEYRDIGRTSADVYERNPEFLLVRVQDRLAARYLLERYIGHVQPGLVRTFHYILGRGDGSRYNMDLHLEPYTVHAQGFLYTRLVVYYVLLGYYVYR
jgi:hypothetical protein